MGSSQNKNNANPLGIMDTMLLCSSYLMSDSFAIPQTVPCRPLCLWDFPGRNTGVGCISFSRGSSWPRDQTHVSCIGRQILYHWATREAQPVLYLWENQGLRRKTGLLFSQWEQKDWICNLWSLVYCSLYYANTEHIYIYMCNLWWCSFQKKVLTLSWSSDEQALIGERRGNVDTTL